MKQCNDLKNVYNCQAQFQLANLAELSSALILIITPTHQISSGAAQISSGTARRVSNCVESNLFMLLDGSTLNHFMIYQCLLIGYKLTIFSRGCCQDSIKVR